MARAVDRFVTDRAGAAAWLEARDDLVVERAVEREEGKGRFEAAEGPLRSYSRTVDVADTADGRVEVTQTVEFRLAVPYFGWLFVLPFKQALRRPVARSRRGGHSPWWAPPALLDPRAATVLGACAAIAVAAGFLNTLFTQTVAFAAEEFGASNRAQGLAGGAVRGGGLIAFVVVATADRRGRRAVLLAAVTAGCALTVTGALAPTLSWLVASQVLARGFATALFVLVGIFVAEEMPAGARAYAVSLVAMAAGLGAGFAVICLNLASLGPQGWRLLYAVPLLALPFRRGVARALPESRRFAAPHAQAPMAGHGRRLWLLGVSAFLTNLFVAPQSQFNNRFLRTERGFSPNGISLLVIATGTPAAAGIVAGGRLADVRGRRVVAAVALAAGSMLTAGYYFLSGWAMWVCLLAANVVAAAAVPSLGVYGPELFPTSLRGRANGLTSIMGLVGSATGLVAAGTLSEGFGRIGPAMALLAAGPVIVAGLVLALYPETAHRELEDLNPEDRAPP